MAYYPNLSATRSAGGGDGPSPDNPLLSLMRYGPTEDQIGTGDLTGSDGAVVSVTRASAKVVPTVEDYSEVASVAANLPAVGAAGLLVERAHTNRIQQSQVINTAPWNLRGTVAVTPNNAVAPDGTMTADLLTGVNTYGGDDFYQSAGGFAVGSIAPAFWIKKVTTSGTLKCGDPAAGTGSWLVDLAALGTGWERITSDHPAVTVQIPFADAAGSNGLQFGAQAGGPLSFHMWGAQAENGAVPHSYVPTAGAVATGAADVVTMDAGNLTDAQWFEVEVTPLWNTPAGQTIMDTRDGSGEDGVALFFDGADITLQVGTDSANAATSTGITWAAGDSYVLRAQWDGAGALAVYRDNTLIAENATPSEVPTVHTLLHIGSDNNGVGQLDGYITRLKWWATDPPSPD